MKLKYETNPQNHISFEDLLVKELPDGALPLEVQEKFDWQRNNTGLTRIEYKGLPYSLDLDDYTVYVDAFRSTEDYQPFTYRQVYLGEADESGHLVGLGIIKLVEDGGVYADMPFVDWTKTMENLRQGRGRRRLIIMNEISKLLFGQTLSSSNNMKPEAESLWANLVHDDLAVPTHDRYRFLQ